MQGRECVVGRASRHRLQDLTRTQERRRPLDCPFRRLALLLSCSRLVQLRCACGTVRSRLQLRHGLCGLRTGGATSGPGGTIKLAAGTYHWKEEITVASKSVTVIGAGRSFTVLDRQRGGRYLRLKGGGHVTFRHLAAKNGYTVGLATCALL